MKSSIYVALLAASIVNRPSVRRLRLPARHRRLRLLHLQLFLARLSRH